MNSAIPIYVGDLRVPIWDLEFKALDQTNIHVTPLGVWQTLGEHGRFMILPDALFDEIDTCLLIEYKGHYILNTVDCCSPNSLKLPQVDLLMSDFAGGASGFPVCFEGGRYDEAWAASFIKNERRKLIERKKAICRLTEAKYYIPFAG